MIVINPINLKITIRAKVGKINPDIKSETIIYFSGKQFDWIRTELTPILANDLSQALKSPNIKDWFGKEVEIYSDSSNIRARPPCQ